MNGIDSFLSDPGMNRNARFAIVTNIAAFTSDRLLTRLALVKNGFDLTVSFGINLISLLLELYPQYLKERLYITNANPSGANVSISGLNK